MDERTAAIDQLNALRQAILERDAITQEMRRVTAAKEEALNNYEDAADFDVLDTNRRAELEETFLAQNNKKVGRKQTAVVTVCTILSLVLFIYSFIFLKGMPDAWLFAQDSSTRFFFWVVHTLLSLILALLPIVPALGDN